jgi:hypothetical protein
MERARQQRFSEENGVILAGAASAGVTWSQQKRRPPKRLATAFGDD